MRRTLATFPLENNGIQESINYVQPVFYTAAEALADWISMKTCPLKYLDVSWNTIRLKSAVTFGKAIACERFCGEPLVLDTKKVR